MDQNDLTPGASAAARTTNNRWMLAVLLALYILAFIDRQIVAMVAEPMKRDLGLTDFQVSLMMGAAFAFVYAIVGLPMGALVDRRPRRTLVFAGVMIWSIAACVCGLAQTFWQLIIARMGVGVGEAGLSPASHSMIADAFPPQRLATAMSVYTLGTVTGTALSLGLGGVILHLFGSHDVTVPVLGVIRGWQLVFLATGVPGLVLSFLVFTFTEPPRRARRSETPPSLAEFGRFWGHRRGLALAYVGSFSLMSVAIYAVQSWTPAYMARQFGWTPIEFGPTLGLVTILAGTVGKLTSGLIVDRMYRAGRRDANMTYYMVALAIATPAAVVGYTSGNPWILLGCLAIVQFFMIPYMGYAIAGLMSVTPNELRGLTSAAFLLTVTLATAIGPSAAAAVTDFVFNDESRLGYSVALVVSACAIVAMIALAFGRSRLRSAMIEAEQWQAAAAAARPAGSPSKG